jgi:hypothetical protein
MHLARAARIEEQMGAGDIGRERETRAGKVACPTARRCLDRPAVEGNVNLSGSPLLRGTVCMKFEAGATS